MKTYRFKVNYYDKSLYRFNKILVVLTLLILCNFASYAQGFRYGAHVGGAMTSIIEKRAIDADIVKSTRFGIQVGATAEYELLSFLSISASISLFQKGDKIKDEFAVSKVRLNYFDIPIQIGYKLPIGNVNVSINIGPYTSVAVGGKRSFSLLDNNTVPNFEWNFQEHGHEAYADNSTPLYGSSWNSYKRFDTGVNFGLKIGFKQYQLNASYCLGFVDIKPNETITAKNSAFGLVFVYYLKY